MSDSARWPHFVFNLMDGWFVRFNNNVKLFERSLSLLSVRVFKEDDGVGLKLFIQWAFASSSADDSFAVCGCIVLNDSYQELAYNFFFLLVLVAILDLWAQSIQVIQEYDRVGRAGEHPMQVKIDIREGEVGVWELPEANLPHFFSFHL